MKALILAGGFGTRLKRVIYDRPKSMALIAGLPFLEHQIRLLKAQGITEFIICVSYMSDKIKSYFGDGKRLGVNITYSEEEVPLGTGGAIKLAERYIDGPFLVFNGDSYSQLNLNEVIKFHKSRKSEFTLALNQVQEAQPYGSAKLEEGKIVDFIEKKESGPGLASSGVYLLNKSIFKYLEPEKNISLEKEIFPILAKEGNLHGYPLTGYFIDIGLPETYSKFKDDVLNSICLTQNKIIREAMEKIERSGIHALLITDEQNKFIGAITPKEINSHILKNGDVNAHLSAITNNKVLTANENNSPAELEKIFQTGQDFVPIIDDEKRVKDIEFKNEEIETQTFPVIRGKTPLRVSFAGGGTDLPYFYGKHGGAVLNAAINKHCYATLVKRADKKIIINSDLSQDFIADTITDLKYDGNLDLIKAVIKIFNPGFGFEIYLHNDLPPGRGLGSSASVSVLIASLFNQMMNTKFNDYKIAEIAYKAEREELKIRGGWQDQYATVVGGFNYMEFTAEKTIVYPLKLKKEVTDELESHLLLCYVGNTHDSGEIHKRQEYSFHESEKKNTEKLLQLKALTFDIKDALLTNHLETFGRLLNETWNIKKSLDKGISNKQVDKLYELGLKNGAYGGRLLGAGSGGYILFFHSPRRRNDLTKAIIKEGGEVLNFKFEPEGTKVWEVKHRF
jgi:D-glycero-alpha-D-manno-heptose-7-phosphate kinase